MKHRITRIAAATTLLLVLSIGSTPFGRGTTATQASRYITGKVTSASGRPLPSAWVIVKQGGAERGRSLTGDDGSYYVSNIGDGAYEILVTRGSGQYTGRVTLPQNRVFNVRVNF